MSSEQACAARVRTQISDILHRNFGKQFRPAFERATSMLGAFPIEPEHELFNAIDHLTASLEYSLKADDATHSGDDREKFARSAQYQLLLARRHLALGRYYSIEHQIIETMQTILRYARRAPDGQDEVKESQQRRADELEARFRGFANGFPPSVKVDDTLDKTVAELELKVDNFMQVHVELMTLAEEILISTEKSGS